MNGVILPLPLRAYGLGGGQVLGVVCVSAREPFGDFWEIGVWLKRNGNISETARFYSLPLLLFPPIGESGVSVTRNSTLGREMVFGLSETVLSPKDERERLQQRERLQEWEDYKRGKDYKSGKITRERRLQERDILQERERERENDYKRGNITSEGRIAREGNNIREGKIAREGQNTRE